MKNKLTLGSLFDGSGGFPLGALMNGIEPVWSSEIEPFPIRVTTRRLPQVRHYGDISKLNGDEIEPVDIITGGFPCQSVSIAGKREGVQHVEHGGEKTTRSGLFYEAVRIIKEMRRATNGKKPRYVVIENVPGLFSSNKGEDFKAVLEALCGIKDEAFVVPEPGGKWENAGCIMGEDFSIAWRVFDAQHWGVPQRRKRIYLVADFADRCAGKILFESEGVPGYSPQGFKSWQGVAGGSKESLGKAGCYGFDGYNGCLTGDVSATLGSNCGMSTGRNGLVLNDQGGQRMDVTEGITATLRATSNHPPLVFENHSQDTRYKGPLDLAPTVSSTYGTGGNNQPFVLEDQKCFDVRFTSEGTRNARQNCYETETSRTIDTGGNTPDSNQGGVAVVAYGICSKESHAMQSDNPHSGFYKADTARCLDANGGNPSCNQGGIAVIEGNGSRPSHKGDGYKESEVMYTLNATEQHGVAYGIDRSAYSQGANAKFGFSVGTEVEPTMTASGAGAVAQPTYCTSKNSYHTVAEKELANTLVATDYKDPPIINDSAPEYIVRRLTPVECARLQGFPDWWCDGLGTENPTDEEIAWWQDVFATYNKAVGKSVKPRSANQIRKWLQSPYTDSAAYKMWGNGVALPCVCFVMAGIAHAALPRQSE